MFHLLTFPTSTPQTASPLPHPPLALQFPLASAQPKSPSASCCASFSRKEPVRLRGAESPRHAHTIPSPRQAPTGSAPGPAHAPLHVSFLAHRFLGNQVHPWRVLPPLADEGSARSQPAPVEALRPIPPPKSWVKFLGPPQESVLRSPSRLDSIGWAPSRRRVRASHHSRFLSPRSGWPCARPCAQARFVTTLPRHSPLPAGVSPAHRSSTSSRSSTRLSTPRRVRVVGAALLPRQTSACPFFSGTRALS